MFLAIQQLKKQKEIRQVKEEILKKDQEILQLQHQLKEAESALVGVIHCLDFCLDLLVFSFSY